MTVKELKPGAVVTVTGYEKADPAYRHKLLRMGLIKGAEFKLLRMAPMGDPVEIEMRGFKLTLRKAEAEILKVDAVS